MAKLSNVAITFKNYMELFPNTKIYPNDYTSSDFSNFEYPFKYKSLDYCLSFYEYYDVFTKIYHVSVILNYNNKKFITYCKCSSYHIRHNLLNLLTALYDIDF